MIAMASQINSLRIVYSTAYSGADQRKHQSSVSLAFEWGIHRWPVSSPHKRPVTRKLLPFDDVIIYLVMIVCVPVKTIVSINGDNLSPLGSLSAFAVTVGDYTDQMGNLLENFVFSKIPGLFSPLEGHGVKISFHKWGQFIPARITIRLCSDRGGLHRSDGKPSRKLCFQQNSGIVFPTGGSWSKNIWAPCHWPLSGEFPGDRWVPRTKGQ